MLGERKGKIQLASVNTQDIEKRPEVKPWHYSAPFIDQC